MPRKKEIFTVETPFERLKTVTLYEDTWNLHIVGRHPEMAEQLAVVETALLTPHMVCAGSAPTRYEFVSPSGGLDLPTVVIVTTQAEHGNGNAVVTAYQSRKHKDPSKFQVLWTREKA